MSVLQIDKLYHELLNAQLDKNWGKVAKIQLEIYKHPDYREDSGEEGTGSVEPDSQDVRDHEGAVR